MGTWIICGAIFSVNIKREIRYVLNFSNLYQWMTSFYTCILWITYFSIRGATKLGCNWNGPICISFWAPDFFGPQEIWALHEKHYIAFSCRDQISRWPKKSGPNEIGDHFSYSHKLAYKHQLLCCNQNKLCFLLQKKSCEFTGALNWNTLAWLQKGFYPTFHSLISDGFRWRRFRVRISIVQLFRGSRRYLVPRQKSWLRRRWGHIWRRPLTDYSYGWSNKRQVCLTLLWVRP